MNSKGSVFIFAILVLCLVNQSESGPCQTTIANCESCTKLASCPPNNQVCEKCAKSYLLTQNRKKCGPSIPGCLYLNNDDLTKCELCSSLTTMREDKKKCGTKIEKCLELNITGQITCVKCMDGYMVTQDGSNCRPYIDNCKFADNNVDYQCAVCEEGYMFKTYDGDDDKKYCYPEIQNCIQLQALPQYCNECEPGYFLNGNRTACIDSLDLCGQGYKSDGDLVDPYCVQINEQCYTGGNFFDDGSGVKCINSSGQCADGYFKDGAGKSCIFNSQDCALTDTAFVGNGAGTGCKNKTNLISPCHPDFTYDSSIQKCKISADICPSSTAPFKDTTSSTGACVPVCPSNTKNDGTDKRCVAFGDKCSDGFMDDGTGTKCIRLPISDSQVFCAAGYKNDGTYRRCIPRGSKCALFYNNDGSDNCIQNSWGCPLGFKKSGRFDDCVPERAKCSLNYKNVFTECGISELGCFDGAQLATCQQKYLDCGYPFLKDDGTGTRCIFATDSCAKGYKNEGSGSLCIPQDWKQCGQGYKDDGTGKRCTIMFSPCAPGFKDDGRGVCIPLDAPCAVYHYQMPDGRCLASCPKGFTINDRTGQCDSSVKNCAIFNDLLECSACKSGYVLSPKSKECYKMIDNCKYYDTVGNCIQCEADFDLFKNTCFAKSTPMSYDKIEVSCFGNLKCHWRVTGTYKQEQVPVPNEQPRPEQVQKLNVNFDVLVEALVVNSLNRAPVDLQ